ncbi:MAG: formyltransferase [Syntrophales bacterium]|nr:formyltransferase [Syntrophales bacterium]MDD5531447.1 formyltransferase [Syntrophales bacterium]HPL63653.1 formyltransferase [Syntrophales bacterium]
MRAVVFAYHNMGIAGLESLLRNGFEVAAIFTHEDDPEENRWFDSVADWAAGKRIPVFSPEDVNKPDWVGRIREMRPRTLFSFYYRKLLSQEILQIPPGGAFNLHGSLLPAYRGRCPVNWVLVRGEKKTGVTLHRMTARADAGDIVGRKEVPIEFEDSAVTLFRKLCRAAEDLMAELLPLIRSGQAPSIPQDPASASYFGGRKPEDGRIAWGAGADEIYNLIRAVTEPYPGAFAFLPRGQKIMIWWAVPEEEGNGGEAGTVRISGDRARVAAGRGRLRLEDVQVGEKRLRGAEIAEFFKTQTGVVLT